MSAVRRNNGGSNRRNAQNRLSRFVFTINNYTEFVEHAIKLWCSKENIKWLVYGHEVGEQGTKHLQGACVIGKQLAFSTVKSLPHFRTAHIESMKGTPQQSLEYCTKEDKDGFFEYGSLPNPGKRNDLLSAVQVLQAGGSIEDLCETEEHACVVAKYSKGLTFISNTLADRTNRVPPVVLWIHGAAGVGKTRSCIEFCTQAQTKPYIHSSGKWFQGYSGQPVCILDDLRSTVFDYDFLLRLLDRYQFTVECKGSSRSFISTVIFITAPDDPQTMFRHRGDADLAQLTRRIHTIIEGSNFKRIMEGIRDFIAPFGPTVLSRGYNALEDSSDGTPVIQMFPSIQVEREEPSVDLALLSESEDEELSCSTTEVYSDIPKTHLIEGNYDSTDEPSFHESQCVDHMVIDLTNQSEDEHISDSEDSSEDSLFEDYPYKNK